MPAVSSGGLGGSRPHSRASARGTCLRRQSLGLNLAHPSFPRPQAILPTVFSFVFEVAEMYIFTHTYIYMYIRMFGKLVLLHPCIPAPPNVASWGPWTQVGYMAHPGQRVPIADLHDHVLPREGQRVTRIWHHVEFHASGGGS
jgi:hypothetical protein